MKGGEGVRYYFSFFMFFFCLYGFVGGREERKFGTYEDDE